MLAAVALVMACGALGHAEDITPVARAALDRATNSYETSHMRFWFARRVRQGLPADRPHRGMPRRGQRCCAELANDAPGLAYANLVFLLGSAELMRGDLRAAGKLLREALAGVENHGVTTGLRPACTFALTELYAKQGEPSRGGGDAGGGASGRPARTFCSCRPGWRWQRGWTLAAGGSLAEAIDTVLTEAKVARDRDQPTHEVACLQAAAAVGRRRRVWTTSPHGPANWPMNWRCRWPMPLRPMLSRCAPRNGEGLLAASRAYQAIGDRCTAADAAAQAAVAFTAAQQRGRGQFAASVGRAAGPRLRWACARRPRAVRPRRHR